MQTECVSMKRKSVVYVMRCAGSLCVLVNCGQMRPVSLWACWCD